MMTLSDHSTTVFRGTSLDMQDKIDEMELKGVSIRIPTMTEYMVITSWSDGRWSTNTIICYNIDMQVLTTFNYR